MPRGPTLGQSPADASPSAYAGRVLTAALAMSIIGLALASVALVIAVVVYREHRARLTSPALRAPRTVLPAPTEPSVDPTAAGPAAFVINPSKVADVDGLETDARVVSDELGLPEPIFLRTTVEDPGAGQAREAVERGASVVVAAGGDGTVRAVATALAGGEVPMALLPSGTGNLLARNLDIPVESRSQQLQAALGGREMAMDLGWLTPIGPTDSSGEEIEPGVDDLPQVGREHLFLVMAGVGFDAAMVADVNPDMKRRVGWVAYFMAGVRHLHSTRPWLEMQVGNGAWGRRRVRTLLFANCGRLPAGLVLLPDAELDDGYIDVAAIDTRSGILGWSSLLWRVLIQGLGYRSSNGLNPSKMDFWRARAVSVRLEEPQAVQVDGDIVGDAVELHVRIQANGLRVRVRR